jgi:hypothetical protein
VARHEIQIRNSNRYIRVLVHLDSPILWIDMDMQSADAIASAVAESSVIKQSGLWIRRDHTLYIQCIDMTHYADKGKDRVLIRGDIDGMLT